MFIIPSDCTGGHLYSHLNKPHNHPFFWCVIEPKDMLILCTDFNNIDFDNIDIEKSSKREEWSTAKNTFDIIIDSKIRIHYIHNILSMKDNEVRRVGGNFYYRYAYKLTYENYIKRLKRMKSTKEHPCFLITENLGFGYTKEWLEKICMETKFKVIALTNTEIKHNSLAKIIKIPDNLILNYFNGRTEYICWAAEKNTEFMTSIDDVG